MKQTPRILIATPEAYRSHILTFCKEQQYDISIATQAGNVQDILESHNISGVIIDNRWLSIAQENQCDIFRVAQEQLIPTVTLIAQGGNNEIVRYFHPYLHQTLPLPCALDELHAMMLRAKMVFSERVSHTLVLLWDRDPAIPQLFTYFFRDNNYNTRICRTVKQAKQLLRITRDPILITEGSIIDNTNITELYKEIRTDEQLQNMPIIAGHVEGSQKDQALASGANGHFGIVFDIEEVWRMIKLLQSDQLRRNLADQ
jgi:DNA-binding NtrC family response regulator